MTLSRLIHCAIIGLAALLIATPINSFAQPKNVKVALTDLPPVRIVTEQENELIRQGCSNVPIDIGAGFVLIPPDHPYPVIPQSAENTNGFFFCPRQAVDSLEVVGQVDALSIGSGALLGAWEGLKATARGALLATFIPGAGNTAAITFAGAKLYTGEYTTSGAIAAIGSSALDRVVFGITYITAQIGNWLLHNIVAVVGILLAANTFIRHPFVTTGWPLVLGIANIGFLLALLFIAATTALRIESFNIRRILPRLLIAALLINFSLILSGVMVDASRILMAIFTTTLKNESIEDLPVQILNDSGLFTEVFSDLTPNPDPDKDKELGLNDNGVYSTAMQMLRATFVIWVLVVSFFTLMVGLFMRYMMLILLLIVSPLAYLAFVLPNTARLGAMWWRMFLRYVFYGPAALFILLVASDLASNDNVVESMFGVDVNSFGIDVSTIESLTSVVLTGAILIAAATVGRYMGIAGSNAALSFAQKQGRRVAYYGTGAGAVVGGARLAGRGARGGARLTGRGIKSGAATLGKIAYGRSGLKEFVDKQRKRGKETVSSLSRSPSERRTLAAQANNYKLYQKAGLSDPYNANNIPVASLGNAAAAKQAGEQNVKAVINAMVDPGNADTSEQQLTVAMSNEEVVNVINKNPAVETAVYAKAAQMRSTGASGPSSTKVEEELRKTKNRIADKKAKEAGSTGKKA